MNLHVHDLFVRKQHLGKTETAEVADAHRIQHADQMIAFVLHYASVKAFDAAIDRITVWIVALVAHPYITQHHAAHAGHGQATLPALFHFIAQRRQRQID